MRSAHSRFIARVVVLALLSTASVAPALAMATGGSTGGGSTGGGSTGASSGTSGGHRAPTTTGVDPCASGAFFRSLHDSFTARYNAAPGGHGCSGSGY